MNSFKTSEIVYHVPIPYDRTSKVDCADLRALGEYFHVELGPLKESFTLRNHENIPLSEAFDDPKVVEILKIFIDKAKLTWWDFCVCNEDDSLQLVQLTTDDYEQDYE